MEERRDCCRGDGEKQNESEDGGMRELRKRFEVFEVGKHSRGKGCQLVVIER